MTTQRRCLFHDFAALLSYPGEDYVATAHRLQEKLAETHPEAAEELQPFMQFLAGKTMSALEELFTRTFEINPPCALEIGWHLFGEEYLRGQLLVRLRAALRRFGIAESTELPDHITHVLFILAAMPAEEAADFAAACLLPAMQKMQSALAGANSPYEKVLQSLRQLTCEELHLPGEMLSAGEEASSWSAGEGGSDLLRRDAGPGWFRENAELVPLQLQFSRSASAESFPTASAESSRSVSGGSGLSGTAFSAADSSAPCPTVTGGSRQ